MATGENARLQYEAGQSAVGMTLLTDSGDATTFTSAATLWSGKSGSAAVVRPNGLLTGGAVTPDDAEVDDTVDVAALTCNLAGIVTAVGAGSVTASRGLTTDVCRITSITVNSSGALAAIAGVDFTAFSEVRGADGGPPYIPVGSIEIAQVRLDSITAAPIASSEIFAVVGVHQERAAYPPVETNNGPTYEAGVQTLPGGSVTFLDALPLIHTGDLPRRVYASYSSPLFAAVSLASDFVAPETTHSVNSTPVYGTTLGSTSQQLGQGSFTAYLENGVSDALVVLKNATLWFKFFPDKYASPHVLCQGKLGIARQWPAADLYLAECTISAEREAIEVVS